MKKLLRKNQIVITALVIMVAAAGYLSMTDSKELQMTGANESVEDPEVADISEEDIVLDDGEGAPGNSAVSGAATGSGDLTASNDTNVSDKAATSNDTNASGEIAGSNDTNASGEAAASNDTNVSGETTASRENAGEAVMVSNTVKGNYFEEAKLSREQTRAKNKETLTELVNNANATEKQKAKAMNEIMKMTEASEKETATENLLAAKGFSEAVVTILKDGVDVVVNAESLTEQQIAQIEDVVKRKTGCEADKIVISPVGKGR